MKSMVVITAEELKDAALNIMLGRPQFFGKYISTVEFVFDASDPEPARRIRCEVVMFETQGGAERYLATGDATEDAPKDSLVEVPGGPAETTEGEKHGRNNGS